MKPMLASTISNIMDLRYPCYVSPKLDGVRALVMDGVVMSRNMKAIPNQHVQNLFGHAMFNGFDGELIVGHPTDKDAYRNTVSGVMREAEEPDVTFWVFDNYLMVNEKFTARLANVTQRVDPGRVRVVPHKLVYTRTILEEWEEKWLEEGYEGAMVRSTDGPYKWGRSTEREGFLLKLKRFADCEAKVIGFDEQMHNGNELTRDELGRAHRTSHKENKTQKGTLGALKVIGINGPYKDVEFDIGTGFSDSERATIWNDQSAFLGEIVKVKYFPTGSKDKPRFPTFLGLRPDEV